MADSEQTELERIAAEIEALLPPIGRFEVRYEAEIAPAIAVFSEGVGSGIDRLEKIADRIEHVGEAMCAELRTIGEQLGRLVEVVGAKRGP